MGICFTVNSKDLFDKKKNPGLNLSVRDVLYNPKIPMGICENTVRELEREINILDEEHESYMNNVMEVLRQKENEHNDKVSILNTKLRILKVKVKR